MCWSYYKSSRVQIFSKCIWKISLNNLSVSLEKGGDKKSELILYLHSFTLSSSKEDIKLLWSLFFLFCLDVGLRCASWCKWQSEINIIGRFIQDTKFAVSSTLDCIRITLLCTSCCGNIARRLFSFIPSQSLS